MNQTTTEQVTAQAKLPVLSERILALLGSSQVGYTPDEAAEVLKVPFLTTRPAFTRLHQAGKIVEANLPGKTALGKTQTAYVIAEEGATRPASKNDISIYYRPYGFGYAEAKATDPYAEPVTAMVKVYQKGKVVAEYESKETEDFVQASLEAILTGLGFNLTMLTTNRG